MAELADALGSGSSGRKAVRVRVPPSAFFIVHFMNANIGYTIGLVLLSSDFRVMGMNDVARQILGPAISDFGQHILKYHPRKNHEKIKNLLFELCSSKDDVPVAMIIDVLNKVLMINLCRIKTSEPSKDFLFAMTFVDVSKETEARIDPRSGLVGLRKFPVFDKGSFQFIDLSSICLIQSDGNYSKLFTYTGNYLSAHEPQKYPAEIRNSPFLQGTQKLHYKPHPCSQNGFI